MRKIFCVFLTLVFLTSLTACRGKNDSGDTLLTNLYTQVSETAIYDTVYNTPSNVVFTEGRYYAFIREDNHNEIYYEKTTDVYEEKMYYSVTDENGNLLDVIPFDVTYVSSKCMTERGLFAAVKENMEWRLHWYGLDGQKLADISCQELRPSSGIDKPAFSENNLFALNQLPVFTGEDEIVMVWGKTVVFYNDMFIETGRLELAGDSVGFMETEDGYFAVYRAEECLKIAHIRSGEVVREYETPVYMNGISSYYDGILLKYHAGYCYFYKDDMVYRYQLKEDEDPAKIEIEPVADLLQSGIPTNVRGIDLFFAKKNDRPMLSVLSMEGKTYTLQLYRPTADIDLTQTKVLHLVGIDISEDIKKEVSHFHRSQTGARILITDYNKYRTKENFNTGYDRFTTDLTTRVIHADILALSTNNLYTLTSAMPGYLIDLYPLMTGTITKDSFYHSVRDFMETDDGKLYGVFRTFYLKGLAGRRDTLGEREGWNLQEFLDFCETLGEDEYIMEQISRENYMVRLFGRCQYLPFYSGKTLPAFTDPLYLRYLSFLPSLPETGQDYMDYGNNNYDALLSGEITADQVEFTEEGENLYWNGKIKLHEVEFSTFYHYYYYAHILGTKDLVYIGYPVPDKHGMRINPSTTYAISSDCAYPDVAWSFLESFLLTTEPVRNSNIFDAMRSPFFSVRSLQEERFAQYAGYEYFFYHDGKSKVLEKDIDVDENGMFNGRSGDHFVITEEDIALITSVLDGEVTSLWKIDSMVAEIAMEEESRYLGGAIPAKECAKNINSRVGIYISEKQ